jgi:hypothetical protein
VSRDKKLVKEYSFPFFIKNLIVEGKIIKAFCFFTLAVLAKGRIILVPYFPNRILLFKAE